MIEKLQTVIARHDELAELMNQPDSMKDMKVFTKMAREHRSLDELVEAAKNYIDTYIKSGATRNPNKEIAKELYAIYKKYYVK